MRKAIARTLRALANQLSPEPAWTTTVRLDNRNAAFEVGRDVAAALVEHRRRGGRLA